MEVADRATVAGWTTVPAVVSVLVADMATAAFSVTTAPAVSVEVPVRLATPLMVAPPAGLDLMDAMAVLPAPVAAVNVAVGDSVCAAAAVS